MSNKIQKSRLGVHGGIDSMARGKFACLGPNVIPGEDAVIDLSVSEQISRINSGCELTQYSHAMATENVQ